MEVRTPGSAALVVDPGVACYRGIPTNRHRANGGVSLVNRRAFVAAGAVGLAAAAAGVRADTPADTAATRLRQFIAMRAALDGRLVIGYVRGRYSGVVDGLTKPLFGVLGATFSRAVPDGDGYRITGFEQAYFTDLDSGVVVDRFANPYTGKSVPVPVTSSRPASFIVGPDLRFRPTVPFPAAIRFEQVAMPLERLGDEIAFIETITASQTAGGHTSYFGDSVILQAPGRGDGPTGPCRTSYQAVVSWRPWLGMGDRPGHMLAFGCGAYGATMSDLPREWLAATRRIRPELLANPAAILDG